MNEKRSARLRPPAGAGVDAVERALVILEALSMPDLSAGPEMRLNLTGLSQRTGLYPSTLLRLCASLERRGFVRRDADGRFRLGPSLWRLGQAYQAGFGLAEIIRPALLRLAIDTGETAAFYVREGDARICLYRFNGPLPVRSHLDEGASLPLDRGAAGHVLMAFTGGTEPHHAQVREAQFALSLGERTPESAAMAVPLFRSGQAFIGALGLAGPITRFTPENITRLAAILSEEATTLNRSFLRG